MNERLEPLRDCKSEVSTMYRLGTMFPYTGAPPLGIGTTALTEETAKASTTDLQSESIMNDLCLGCNESGSGR